MSLTIDKRLEDDFNQAAARISSGQLWNLSQDEQLSLYGMYTVVRKGSAPEKSPSALFDPRAHAKWNSWREHSHLNREDAMLKYTELVTSLASADHKGSSKKPKDGFGNKASTGCDIPFDEQTTEQTLDLCYWAATGDLGNVLDCLEKLKISPDYRDSDNLTPLIRAADRDQRHVVDILVSAGADIDAVDDDGQSALHYAVYCEHVEMAALLVSYGASLELRDGEGLTPADIATSSVTAALEEVKAGTWKRSSERFRRDSRRIPFILTSSTFSYGTLAGAIIALLAAVVGMYYRIW